MADRSESNFPVYLFFGVLLLIGAALAGGGAKSIRSRHFECGWEQSGGFQVGPIGFAGHATHGVDVYDGAPAVRVGTGLVTWGAMFSLWALAGLWASLRPERWRLSPTTGYVLTACSIVLQVTSVICLSPPWELRARDGPAMWATIMLLASAACFCWWLSAKIQAKAKWCRRIVGGSLIVCIGAGIVLDKMGGVIFGILVTFSLALHLLILVAPWHKAGEKVLSDEASAF